MNWSKLFWVLIALAMFSIPVGYLLNQETLGVYGFLALGMLAVVCEHVQYLRDPDYRRSCDEQIERENHQSL